MNFLHRVARTGREVELPKLQEHFLDGLERFTGVLGRLIDKIDYALVTFSWATGCRASEVASVSLDSRQPNRIDLHAGLVTITDAKCDSRGTVPLDAASLRVIRRYVREIRPRIRNADVMHQLFLTKTGSPYNSNKMTKKMRMLLRRYGLDDKSSHSFRHFFCTDLLRRGVALHEAKAAEALEVVTRAGVQDADAFVSWARQQGGWSRAMSQHLLEGNANEAWSTMARTYVRDHQAAVDFSTDDIMGADFGVGVTVARGPDGTPWLTIDGTAMPFSEAVSRGLVKVSPA